MNKIVIASNNQKKLKELKEILDGFGIKVVSQQDVGINIEVEESGNTFEENALLKARAICNLSNLPTLADDSGLMVEALNGEPGVFSARYAGENASDDDRINKLLQNLKDVSSQNRGAKFVCVIAFCLPNDKSITFKGECFGNILTEKLGEGGFGYDPVFYVKEFNKTFAQLSNEQKNKISHRGKVLQQFKEYMESLGE